MSFSENYTEINSNIPFFHGLSFSADGRKENKIGNGKRDEQNTNKFFVGKSRVSNEVAQSEKHSSSDCDDNDHGTNEPGKTAKPNYNCLVPREMWSQEMNALYAQKRKSLKDFIVKKDKRLLIQHKRIHARFKYLMKELKKKVFNSDKFEEIQELAKISRERENKGKCVRKTINAQRHLVNKAKLKVLGPNLIENYVTRGYRLLGYMRESEQFKEFLRRYALDNCDPKLVPQLIGRLKKSELHLLERKARHNFLAYGRTSDPPRRCPSPAIETESPSRNNAWKKDDSPKPCQNKFENRSRHNSSDNHSASRVPEANSSKSTPEKGKDAPASSVNEKKSEERIRLPSLLDDIVLLRESMEGNTKSASLPQLPSSSARSDTQQHKDDSVKPSNQRPKIDSSSSNASASSEKPSSSNACGSSEKLSRLSKLQGEFKPGDNGMMKQESAGSHREELNAHRNYNANVPGEFDVNTSAKYHRNEGGWSNNEGGWSNNEGGWSNNEGGWSNSEGGWGNNEGGWVNNGLGQWGNNDPAHGPYDGRYYRGNLGYFCPYPGPSNYYGAPETHHGNLHRSYDSTEMHYSGSQGSYYSRQSKHEDRPTTSKYNRRSSHDSDDSREHHSSYKKSRHSSKYDESSSSSRRRYK